MCPNYCYVQKTLDTLQLHTTLYRLFISFHRIIIMKIYYDPFIASTANEDVLKCRNKKSRQYSLFSILAFRHFLLCPGTYILINESKKDVERIIIVRGKKNARKMNNLTYVSSVFTSRTMHVPILVLFSKEKKRRR